MTGIDLTKVAPQLLQVIGLSLPTIAIFVTLGGQRNGRESYELAAFNFSLAALLLVAIAAGFNVGYLALYRSDLMFYIAVIAYLVSLVFLLVSTGWVLFGRLRGEE